MIRQSDLDEAILECQGKRNPDAQTCVKLAAFLTIREHLYGQSPEYQNSYSYSNGSGDPVGSVSDPDENIIHIDSNTEFARLVSGRKSSEIWPVIDEAIDTIRIINERLYDAIMAKLS